MEGNAVTSKSKLSKVIKTLLPFISWFEGYRLEYLKADFFAGISVSLILIPQSMAYAQLAGLPTYYGLYASLLPPLIAVLFGSSRQLATGPVAIVSLMTAACLEPIVSSGSTEYISYAILLAFLVGLFQIILGFLRLGFLINFLSHPFINGFTNAAAIIIATSQFEKFFGVSVTTKEHHFETVYNVIIEAFYYAHLPTFAFAVLSFLFMFLLKRYFPKLPYVLIVVVITTLISYYSGYYYEMKVGLDEIQSPRIHKIINSYNSLWDLLQDRSAQKVQMNQKLQKIRQQKGKYSKEVNDLEFALISTDLDIQRIKEEISKLKKLLKHEKFYTTTNLNKIILRSIDSLPEKKPKYLKILHFKVPKGKIDPNNVILTSGGNIVGKIPQELPTFKAPNFNLEIIGKLISYVAIISLLGFLEAISIAKSIAVKTNQKLYANRELVGQGLANLVGSFFQSYPVSGSFSRSAANFQFGAVSGISSVVTSIFVGFAILFLTPYLYYLPQAVLASLIILAVIGLINIHGFIHDWKSQKYDGIVGIITFIATLYYAPHIDYGIFVGVALSIILFIRRRMKPEIAYLSKHPDTTFRNRERFALKQCKQIAVIRFNGPLVFKNVNYLENVFLRTTSSMPELKYIVLVGNAINEIDASGDFMLASFVDRIRETGIDLFITGLNDSVMDSMKRTLLYYKIGDDHFFRNVAQAVDALWESSHCFSSEERCPLKEVVYE